MGPYHAVYRSHWAAWTEIRNPESGVEDVQGGCGRGPEEGRG